MLRFLAMAALAPLGAGAQTSCPQVNFQTARTVNLKPTATTHIDVVRQPDGSYTGYEITDISPYRIVAQTPHFEQQFAACLGHALPPTPAPLTMADNPPGAGSQAQVSLTLPNGGAFVARLIDNGPGNFSDTLYFDTFDAQHNLLSETPFTSVVTPPGYVGSANEHFMSVTMADLNGDGRLDLLVLFDTPLAQSMAYGGVWTFLGNGDGTFQPGVRQVLTSAGMLAAAQAMAVGDLNGDGKPDLVIGRSPFTGDPLVIAFGNGDGTFSQRTQSVSTSCGPSAAIADLDRDGHADLVVGCTNEVQVLLGKGDGTFQAPTNYSALMPFNPRVTFVPIAVGDLNGDGIPDIATAGGTILYGDGRGGFPSRKDYAQPNATSVMVTDFDRDGKADVVFGLGSPAFLSGSISYPSLTVLLGSGSGTFAGAAVVQAGVGTPVVTAGDFNGDGTTELAIASQSDHAVNVMFSGATRTLDAGNLVISMTAADFNRDGRADLAVLTAGGQVNVFPSIGGSNFGTPYIVPVPSGTLDSVSAADINGDGIPDLVVAAGDTLFLWLAKGDGTFGTPIMLQQAGAVQQAVAFGDFNADGKLDIAIVPAGGFTVTVLLGNGDGTFPTSVSTPLSCQAHGDAGSVAAADFNRDRRLDLAVECNAGSYPFIQILLGQGNGQFTRVPMTQGGVYGLAVADVNGDKIPDLISGAGTSGGEVVRLGNGDGTFADGTTFFAISGYVSVADFNGDKLPDVALAIPAYGTAVFLNLSQSPPPLTVVSAATFTPGPLVPGEIATAFGEFQSEPGLTVSVAGQPASVLYASATQVNFLVPDGLNYAPATITVTTPAGTQLSAQVQIVPTAPALFTLGSGLAAAYAVHVAPDGTQTIQPVSSPIRVDQPGQTYLTLFGTGLGLATTGYVSALVQGEQVPVTYAGPQPNTPGLDQVNILLPSSLAGTGTTNIHLDAALGSGPFPVAISNTVYVTIQ